MKDPSAAARRLIDRHRLPLQRTGEVRSILAVTHNLEADFFDHDLLPNVLNVAHADDHSFSGRVALQRKLAMCEHSEVLVEATAYQGRPSLRTTVYPIAARGRRLHAKLVVIEYEHALLLSIGSANLTSAGYRSNREVAGVLATYEDEENDAGLIVQALAGAATALREVAPKRADAVCEQLDRVRQRVIDWHGASSVASRDILWSGRGLRLVDAFIDRWPSTVPVERLCIVSPFWSEDGGESAPLRSFLERLQQRSGLAQNCRVDLYMDADALQGGEYAVRYPAGFQLDYAPLGEIAVFSHAVDPLVDPAELDVNVELKTARALHAKLVLCTGGGRGLLYAGSGNFTRRGWGFTGAANTEAGWLAAGPAEELLALLPRTTGKPAVVPSGVRLKPPAPDEPEGDNWWPDYVLDVVLEPAAREDALQLRVRWEHGAPDCFEIGTLGEVDGAIDPSVPGTLLVEARSSTGGNDVASLPPELLRRLLVDREVRVFEPATGRFARFPVNVAAGEARLRLPIAPGADRPGENALLAYYQGRISFEDLYPDPADGPRDVGVGPRALEDSGVDTSRIQSYQVRAFVEALPGIRAELSQLRGPRPIVELAYLGDVSPAGLARAILEQLRAGTKSPVAAAFELVELRVLVREMGNQTEHPDPDMVREVVARAVERIDAALETARQEGGVLFGPEFGRYKTAVCGEVAP